MRWSLWKWNLQMSFYIHAWDKQLAPSIVLYFFTNLLLVNWSKWLMRKILIFGHLVVHTVLVFFCSSLCLLFVKSWLMFWWEKYSYLDFGGTINDTKATHDTSASRLGLLSSALHSYCYKNQYDNICSSVQNFGSLAMWSVCASPVCQLAGATLPIFLRLTGSWARRCSATPPILL